MPWRWLSRRRSEAGSLRATARAGVVAYRPLPVIEPERFIARKRPFAGGIEMAGTGEPAQHPSPHLLRFRRAASLPSS